MSRFAYIFGKGSPQPEPDALPTPSFIALEKLFEVEVRNLAGESWTVLSGDKVTDLKAALTAAAPFSGIDAEGTQLFAEGERLTDDHALPAPSVTGERLVVHISTTNVAGDEATSDPPDSPSRPATPPPTPPRRTASPTSSKNHRGSKSLPCRAGPLCLLFTTITTALLASLLTGSTSAEILPTPRGAPHRGAQMKPPQATRLASYADLAGYGPVTARLALEAKDRLANSSMGLRLSASLGTGAPSPPSSSPSSSSPSPPATSTKGSSPAPKTAPAAPTTLGSSPSKFGSSSPPSPRPLLGSITLGPSSLSLNVSTPDLALDLAGLVRSALEYATEAAYDAAELKKTPDDDPKQPPPVAAAPLTTEHVTSSGAQLLKAFTVQPLAAAALAAFRPFGSKLLALTLLLAKASLPTKRCKQLVELVEAYGLVPKGYEGNLGAACDVHVASGSSSQADKKKL